MREEIIKELKTVYDPEITSINIFDLGLVYDIDIKEKDVTITHTLTSMFCPMADEIQRNIKTAVERVEGVGTVKVKLTHTPPFTKEMMSEEARMALNLLVSVDVEGHQQDFVLVGTDCQKKNTKRRKRSMKNCQKKKRKLLSMSEQLME